MGGGCERFTQTYEMCNAPIARLSSGWRSLSRMQTGIPQNLLNRLVGVDPSPPST